MASSRRAPKRENATRKDAVENQAIGPDSMAQNYERYFSQNLNAPAPSENELDEGSAIR